MKIIIQIIFLFGLQTITFGQETPRPLNSKDSIDIEKKVEQLTQELKKDLTSKEEKDIFQTNLDIEFALDTFEIEKKQELKLEIDYSTNGMVTSTLDLQKKYDNLLNKYYNKLLKNLQEDEKQYLINSQKNWIKFRDSEIKLNNALTQDYYSGGGTIQRVFAASRYLDITRDRVIEIYRYLSRKM